MKLRLGELRRIWRSYECYDCGCKFYNAYRNGDGYMKIRCEGCFRVLAEGYHDDPLQLLEEIGK